MLTEGAHGAAEGVAVYPWWVQRPPGGPIPPPLRQIADHVLPGRATVRLQQLVRAGDGSLRSRGTWVNAAQYAVLVTDLTETEEERCAPGDAHLRVVCSQCLPGKKAAVCIG